MLITLTNMNASEDGREELSRWASFAQEQFSESVRLIETRSLGALECYRYDDGFDTTYYEGARSVADASAIFHDTDDFCGGPSPEVWERLESNTPLARFVGEESPDVEVVTAQAVARCIDGQSRMDDELWEPMSEIDVGDDVCLRGKVLQIVPDGAGGVRMSISLLGGGEFQVSLESLKLHA